MIRRRHFRVLARMLLKAFAVLWPPSHAFACRGHGAARETPLCRELPRKQPHFLLGSI